MMDETRKDEADLERLWALLDRLAAIGRERRQRTAQQAAQATRGTGANEVASDG